MIQIFLVAFGVFVASMVAMAVALAVGCAASTKDDD
jgi:hypothetical protein